MMWGGMPKGGGGPSPRARRSKEGSSSHNLKIFRRKMSILAIYGFGHCPLQRSISALSVGFRASWAQNNR